MLTPWILFDRIENGPSCTEKEFDLEILYPTIQKLIKENNLYYDAKTVIPSDDDLIDHFFKAGLQLAVDVGLFCIDTSRRLLVSKKEILEAADILPKSVTLGSGRDARTMGVRGIADKQPPFTIVGPTGGGVTEEVFIPLHMSYFLSPYPDGICNGAIVSLHDQIAKTNSAIEPYAAKAEIRWIREILTRVGRPGMVILGGQSTVATKTGYIASTHPDYLRSTDSLGTAILNEMKIDYDRLTKVIHNAEIGAFTRSLQDPIIGGLAGGPVGAALVGIASILIGQVINHPVYHTIHPVHRLELATSCRMGLWLESVVAQTFATNTRILITGNLFNAAGPGEKMLLQEVAANSLAITVSGGHLGPGPASGNSKYVDHYSGLEGIFMTEVGHAVARSGWTREQTNEVVNDLLTLYEKRLMDPPQGKTFQEVYNIKSITPHKGWQKLRDEMVTELKKKDLEFLE